MNRTLQKIIVLVVLFLISSNAFSQKNESYIFSENKSSFANLENAKIIKSPFQKVKIGFDFSFNNLNHNTVFVSNEGWISFENSTSVKSLIREGNVNSFISPLLFFNNNEVSKIYNVSVYTTNEEFVVQWKNSDYSFQALLYNNGEIEFRYSENINIKEANFLAGIVSQNYMSGYFPSNINKKKNLPIDKNAFANSNSVTYTQSKGVGSTITAGAGTEPLTIAETIDTQAEAVLNFDFVYSCDGDNDEFSQVVFTRAVGDQTGDWTSVIAGAELVRGSDVVPGSILANSITFASADFPVKFGQIRKNNNVTFVLRIWLVADVSANYGDHIVFSLQDEGFTMVSADAIQNVDLQSGDGNNEIVQVVAATELRFGAGLPTTVQPNTSFNVTVMATDASGVIDVSKNCDIDLSLSGGTGTLSSASGLTQTLVNGTYTWNDVQYDTEEIFSIKAADGGSCGGLTFVISPNITCEPASVITIGSGGSTTSTYTPYRGLYEDAKFQYIITAAELLAAGLNPGADLTSLAFNVSSVSSSQAYTGFTIKIGHTSSATFPSVAWLTPSFTTCYSSNYSVSSTGWNTHTFTNNFTWNGSDNIVIQTCFDNTSYTSNDPVYYNETSGNTVCENEADGDSGCSLPAESTSTYRPNMRFEYSGGTPGEVTISAGNDAETATIPSTVDTQAEALINFDFSIDDPGTDGDPVLINEIRIQKGVGNDVADWSTVIAGALLTDGSNIQTADITVNADNITITNISFSGGNTLGKVDNGTSKEYTLKVWLNCPMTGVNDHDNLVFKVTNSDISNELSGSSRFATGQITSSSATDNEITITATELQFVTDAPATMVALSTDFTVTINATDGCGNIDTDYTGSVTVSLNSGTGSLTSATGLTQNLVAGTYTWTDCQYDAIEIFRIGATDGNLPNLVSWDINCIAEVVVGTGTTSTTVTPYQGWNDAGRMQIIYTAADLLAAGLPSGAVITSLGFNVDGQSSTQPYTGLTVKMAHTSDNSFASANWLSATWTTVQAATDYTTVDAWNIHPFSSNFVWNGTDNIAVEVCFDNDSYTSDDDVFFTSTGSSTVCYAETDADDIGCSLTAEWTSTSRPNIKFNYEPPSTDPPTITNVTPTLLYEDKGKILTITGTNFYTSTVTLGGITGSITTNTGTSMEVLFPAGNYSGNTLEVDNGNGVVTNTSVTVSTRNIIPVNASAVANDDTHQTIQSACDGLFAWYGTTAFSAGDLPGGKIIDVYSGTYAESVTPNSTLNTVDLINGLIIQAHTGEQPIVDATGLSSGFSINLDFTTIKGFTVFGANSDNIISQGDNCVISYNKCYNGGNTGIKVSQTVNVHNNLVYDNVGAGIYVNNSDNAIVESNTVYNNGGTACSSGYSVEVDTGGGSPNIYNWEYNAAWTQLSFEDDDEKTIDFGTNGYPFEFDFWGTHYGANVGDSIGISSNGHFLLDGDIYGPGLSGISNSLDYDNHSLSWHGNNSDGDNPLGNDNFISCFWDDMYNDANHGDVRYHIKNFGTDDEYLVVTWFERRHYKRQSDGWVSVEVKIFESTHSTLPNVIEFHYNDVDYDYTGFNNAETATIGIKKDDATYLEYSFDSPVNSSLRAIRYTPNPSTGAAVYIASGSGTIVRNNILYAKQSTTNDYYTLETGASNVLGSSTYNTYFKGTNAQLVDMNGTNFADLAAWSGDGTGDIETDPLFVTNGTDFHIMSDAGGASYHNGEWPPLTASTGTWTDDSNISPCVNTGTGDYTYEPEDNGNIRNQGVYGNTVQATRGVAIPGIWTGVVSTVWNEGGNWSDGIIPLGCTGSGFDATIPDVSVANGGSGNFPIISASAQVEDLTIEAGANLTIDPTGALTVCGLFTNTPGIAGLFIKSDATGTGSLIHSTVGINATIETYLSGLQYHYLSSPIIGATTDNLNIQGGTFGIEFYDWDASMEWLGMGIDPYGVPSTIDYTPWGTVLATNLTLDIGKGYAYYYDTQTIVYQGEINVADYSKSTSIQTTLSTGVLADQGWNLMGNPYASSLDWDIVATDISGSNKLEKALYLFDDTDGSGSQANYIYYVGAGGTAPGIGTQTATRFIPPGQGFFVRTGNANYTLPINSSSRVHATQIFYKEEQENVLRFVIENETYSDEMVLRLLTDATMNFDGSYDARKLIPSNSNIPQMFSITEDSAISAINSLPKYNKELVVNLGVIAQEGDFIIKLSENTLVTGRTVYLIDLYEGTQTKMEKGVEYAFSYAGGIDNDRFQLRFEVNHTPIANNFEKNVTEDVEFNFQIPENTFTDIDENDQLIYSLETQLPSWLNFDMNTKSFSGLALNENVGVYPVEIKATDMFGETATAIIYIDVENTNDAPYLAHRIESQSVEVNTQFSYRINDNVFADMDVDDNLTLSVKNMPSWLNFNSFIGKFSGIPTNVGNYEIIVTATDMEGASVSDKLNITVTEATGINNLSAGILVQPNPSNGIFTIVVNKKYADDYFITITDELGKVVIKTNKTTNNARIDMSKYSSGTYFLNILFDDNTTFNKKIIIK